MIFNFTYSNIEEKIYINAYPEDDLNSLNVGMLGWSISMADGLLDRFNLSGTGCTNSALHVLNHWYR